jgi:hypothetical protein
LERENGMPAVLESVNLATMFLLLQENENDWAALLTMNTLSTLETGCDNELCAWIRLAQVNGSDVLVLVQAQRLLGSGNESEVFPNEWPVENGNEIFVSMKKLPQGVSVLAESGNKSGILARVYVQSLVNGNDWSALRSGTVSTESGNRRDISMNLCV